MMVSTAKVSIRFGMDDDVILVLRFMHIFTYIRKIEAYLPTNDKIWHILIDLYGAMMNRSLMNDDVVSFFFKPTNLHSVCE